MATAVKVKRRLPGGANGAPSGLKTAEIAYNMTDGILYIGYGDDGSGNATGVKSFARDDFSTLKYANFPGGSAGQVLVKASNSDYDYNWATVSAGTTYTASGGITLTGSNFAITPNGIDNTMLRQGIACSVVGRPQNSVGNLTDIQAAADGQVLRRAAGVVGFGALTKSDVGLANVDNTSDANKPISTATQTALDLKAPLNNPTFTGTVIVPTASQGDNSTKAASTAYVDTAVASAQQGLNPKQAVKAASVANLTLSGEQTVDGVALVTGDRVLVKAQTAAQDNGIYVVAAGAWSRAADMDAWSEVPGAYVFAMQGTANSDVGFISTADPGGTLGTTAMPWQQFTGAGQITAGNGIAKTGNTLSLNVSGAGLSLGTSLSLSGNVSALAGLTLAADTLAYGTGAGAMSTTTLSAFGRSLIDDADASAARTTLGLGSMATQAASAVNITGGTIDGVTLDGGTF